jgi:hypothetical protein
MGSIEIKSIWSVAGECLDITPSSETFGEIIPARIFADPLLSKMRGRAVNALTG